jgi:hypothetical protein
MAREVKPLDVLWMHLNDKTVKELSDHETMQFINLVRKCNGQEPLHRDENDTTRNHNSAKKNAYLKEWRAKKKAEQSRASQS